MSKNPRSFRHGCAKDVHMFKTSERPQIKSNEIASEPTAPPSDAQLSLQRLLRNRFIESKTKNQSYTMRSFAQRVGLSSGALSEILRGRRKVSEDLALKIARNLGLDPRASEELRQKFLRDEKSQRDSEFENTLQLSSDQFRLISEWYHFAILSLLKTPDFKNDAPWIAARLGIRSSVASEALRIFCASASSSNVKTADLSARPRVLRPLTASKTWHFNILTRKISRSPKGAGEPRRRQSRFLRHDVRDVADKTHHR